MDSALSVMSLANQFISVSPFLAGAIVALAARTANPRVRWLVLVACLLPLVSVVGSRVLIGADFLIGLRDDALYLAYDLTDIGEQLLVLVSGVLFLLAIAIVFRSRGDA